MPSRLVALVALVSFAAVTSCRLPTEAPPQEPAAAPVFSEAGPLPPEETPPPEEPAEEPRAAPPVEPGVALTGAPRRGKLPKAVIDEKLSSTSPAIQACYEQGLKTNPQLRGSVNVNFVVGEEGKVVHADAAEGDDALPHPPTVDCILGVIRGLEFPKPSGGRVFLNYPLTLEPPKAPAP